MPEQGVVRVKWREWEEGAFSQAQAEGKLIFLDISAKWCHWCHVLDRTSLSDPRVVRLLNDSFIPVRVDTDRRPDINDRYNQGGWPTTAVRRGYRNSSTAGRIRGTGTRRSFCET